MVYQIENILVPTDFSEAADNALRIAIAIAQRHRAAIHILNIVPVNSMPLAMELRQGKGDEMALLIGISKQRVESIGMDVLKKYGISTVAQSEFGTVSTNVSAYVVANKVDMVIMGSHGISGWKEFLIGSNAMAVIKECSCPVLTIPLQFTKTTFDKLLYPVRNVSGVLEKYNYIKSITEKNDAEIHLLGLIQGSDVMDTDLLAKLTEVKDTIYNAEKRISFESRICKDMADEVLSSAIERSADMVVINASFDASWTAFFSGSYTQQIVNHAAIPVLSIKT